MGYFFSVKPCEILGHLMKFGSGYRSITGEVWVSEASGRDGRKGSIEMGIYIDIDL